LLHFTSKLRRGLILVMPNSKLIGLIGGLGPAATTLYYRLLLEAAGKRNLTLRLLMNHADVNRVLELAAVNAAPALAHHLDDLIDELRRAGSAVVGIGAVTAHLCAPLLNVDANMRFVDLIDSLHAELERRQLQRVALLGTRAVTNSRLFGRLAEAVNAPDDAVVTRIDQLYVSIVRSGVAEPAVALELGDIAHRLAETHRAEAIVLAGTELSLVPQHVWGSLCVVDCARVHVAALMDAAAA